jgi:hypothetical protein
LLEPHTRKRDGNTKKKGFPERSVGIWKLHEKRLSWKRHRRLSREAMMNGCFNGSYHGREAGPEISDILLDPDDELDRDL